MSSGDVGLDVALRTAILTDLFGSWEVALGLSSRVTSASPIRHNDLFAEDGPPCARPAGISLVVGGRGLSLELKSGVAGLGSPSRCWPFGCWSCPGCAGRVHPVGVASHRGVDDVGQAPFQAAEGFFAGLAGFAFAQVVGPAFGVGTGLGDRDRVETLVQAPVPAGVVAVALGPSDDVQLHQARRIVLWDVLAQHHATSLIVHVPATASRCRCSSRSQMRASSAVSNVVVA